MSPDQAGSRRPPADGAITGGLAKEDAAGNESAAIDEGTLDEGAVAATARGPAEVSFRNLTILLLLAQTLTGLTLLFHYRPTVSTAYFDIVDLREISNYGFARSLHLWGAYAALIVVWLHLLRTAMRGVAGNPHRRRTWFQAIALMLCILAFATTGTLLPWDTKAYWSLAELATTTPTARDAPVRDTPTLDDATPSAPTPPIDGDTLSGFYVIHCFVLPLLTIGSFALARRRRSS